MSGGRILTFFWYKGGVGRTMTAAKCRLAKRARAFRGAGQNIPDLEAPRLHRFFKAADEPVPAWWTASMRS
jgi:hypothetical protein